MLALSLPVVCLRCNMRTKSLSTDSETTHSLNHCLKIREPPNESCFVLVSFANLTLKGSLKKKEPHPLIRAGQMRCERAAGGLSTALFGAVPPALNDSS